jgi:hypothetical protein
MAKGQIASPELFVGCLVQIRGVSVRQWKVLRTPVQKETSIMYPFLQKFVNCIENRKIQKNANLIL